jgi:hypothetical protein
MSTHRLDSELAGASRELVDRLVWALVISEIAEAVGSRGSRGGDSPGDGHLGLSRETQVKRIVRTSFPLKLGGPVTIHSDGFILGELGSAHSSLDRQVGSLHTLVVSWVGTMKDRLDRLASLVRGEDILALHNLTKLSTVSHTIKGDAWGMERDLEIAEVLRRRGRGRRATSSHISCKTQELLLVTDKSVGTYSTLRCHSKQREE